MRIGLIGYLLLLAVIMPSLTVAFIPDFPVINDTPVPIAIEKGYHNPAHVDFIHSATNANVLVVNQSAIEFGTTSATIMDDSGQLRLVALNGVHIPNTLNVADNVLVNGNITLGGTTITGVGSSGASLWSTPSSTRIPTEQAVRDSLAQLSLSQVLSFGNTAGTRIRNLGTPTAGSDAATKAYVDASGGGGSGGGTGTFYFATRCDGYNQSDNFCPSISVPAPSCPSGFTAILSNDRIMIENTAYEDSVSVCYTNNSGSADSSCSSSVNVAGFSDSLSLTGVNTGSGSCATTACGYTLCRK